MDIYFPPQTFKAAGVLASRVSLDQVHIEEASFHSLGNWDGTTVINREAIAHSAPKGSFRFDESANTLDIQVSLESSLKGKKSTDPSFKVKAVFVARYHLTTNPPPPDMWDLFFGSFSKVNALLNVWPYWREFASSCNDRMGLPHWNLPVLRLLPEPEKASSKAKKAHNLTSGGAREMPLDSKKKRDK